MRGQSTQFESVPVVCTGSTSGTCLRMKRLVLFALVGGGIGAGAAYFRSDPTAGSSDEGTSDLTKQAASGAAAGAVVGLLLDRRAKRKRQKNSMLTGYADKARPKVDAAVEAAFAAA